MNSASDRSSRASRRASSRDAVLREVAAVDILLSTSTRRDDGALLRRWERIAQGAGA